MSKRLSRKLGAVVLAVLLTITCLAGAGVNGGITAQAAAKESKSTSSTPLVEWEPVSANSIKVYYHRTVGKNKVYVYFSRGNVGTCKQITGNSVTIKGFSLNKTYKMTLKVNGKTKFSQNVKILPKVKNIQYSVKNGKLTLKWSGTGRAAIVSGDQVRTSTGKSGRLGFYHTKAYGSKYTFTYPGIWNFTIQEYTSTAKSVPVTIKNIRVK